MPYIITTTPGCFDNARCVGHEAHPHAGTFGLRFCEKSISRRAVATLEEARDAVIDVAPVDDLLGRLRLSLETPRLAESGGTIGPLPDGTTIGVEFVSMQNVAAAAGAGGDYHHGRIGGANVIAAFDETQQ